MSIFPAIAIHPFLSIFDDLKPFSYRFGSELYPSDSWTSPVERSFLRSTSKRSNYIRSQLARFDEIEKELRFGKDGFQVNLDVQHFQPNEITVKMENNEIVVHAKHEEKRDEHGYISRGFTQRFELPLRFKTEEVTSSLSSDGVLSIKCPNPPSVEGSNVRIIPISQTGPAKQSNEEKPEENKENAAD